MAHLLAKLGKEALKPQFVNNVWRKPAISAKNAARLRKEALMDGEEWSFDEPRKEPKQRKPKGHKHDKLKPIRQQAIEANLQNMDTIVEKHRAEKAKRLASAPFIDRLLLTAKQLRLKQRG